MIFSYNIYIKRACWGVGSCLEEVFRFINESKDFGDFQTFPLTICIDIKRKLTQA